MERFFDEAGGAQLVIHSPYGSRMNRAWGLALRKRFCRKFNFELQAAATEDNIVLSLTASHSFKLEDVQHYLSSATVREVLIQALLDSPMFTTRWRWIANISLALPRFRGGKKVPPQFARMEAEDLLAAIFPDQVACGENLVGEREIPEHPLVDQVIGDCLNEAMDIEALEALLKRTESGAVKVEVRDLTEPSPLALEVLSARPYAYLDDAPLEERRTQAVMARRFLSPEDAAGLGRLDPEAIARVRGEAWPDATNADELHDALAWLGFLTEEEVAAQPGWGDMLDALARDRRAARIGSIWITAERLPQFRAVFPDTPLVPEIAAPEAYARDWSSEEALVEIVRGRLEGQGPVTEPALAEALGVKASDISSALISLEVEGFAMRGHFSAGANAEEWCDRRLLARIHGYTVKRLRAEIEPVAARDFIRFLCAWQRVTADTRMEGPDALEAIVAQLEGFEAPAGAWESEILRARLAAYDPAWLDDLSLAGRVTWARLRPRVVRTEETVRGATPVRTTPITLLQRRHAAHWAAFSPIDDEAKPGRKAQAVLDAIRVRGASFFDELIEDAGLLRTEVEDALAELVALGLVASDSFAGLRVLLMPSDKRKYRMDDVGRWALARRSRSADTAQSVEHVARTLLRRYGVVFAKLIEREADWLPPWRELLRVLRRLEARGEVRGGRFVAGFVGEQFALPEAVGALREMRKKPPTGTLVSLSGADPLNLIGILTPKPRLAALAGNRLVWRDGIPLALLAGGEVQLLEELDAATEWEVKKALLRSAARRDAAAVS